MAAIKPKTAIDVLRSTNRSLAYIIAEQKSDAFVKAVLSILISDTADFLNLGKTINGSQIAQTVELILEDFSIYKIDYFILCFNNAKKGRYGKQFDRLDGQVIFEWLAQFDYEYSKDIEDGRVKEKALREKGKYEPEFLKIVDPKDIPVPMPDYVKEAYLKAIYKPVDIKVEPIKTPEQILIDGFMADFNGIYNSYKNGGGVRIISIYGAPGKSMNIQEYVEYRVLEYQTGHCLERCISEIKKYHKQRFEKIKDKKLKSWKN